jgi:hypothetical protein
LRWWWFILVGVTVLAVRAYREPWLRALESPPSSANGTTPSGCS